MLLDHFSGCMGQKNPRSRLLVPKEFWVHLLTWVFSNFLSFSLSLHFYYLPGILDPSTWYFHSIMSADPLYGWLTRCLVKLVKSYLEYPYRQNFYGLEDKMSHFSWKFLVKPYPFQNTTYPKKYSVSASMSIYTRQINIKHEKF